ncbi:PREDICTED: kynurenine formamidase-like [Prunus mume]|uniref:Kynurenine formamidase-like n=1 Tax=Prunus mume TaxID=102107 RepID=A0ABM0P9X0_PRUMU|nr:PREDICTED: kynurenine formamidase-like [Prunus mume]
MPKTMNHHQSVLPSILLTLSCFFLSSSSVYSSGGGGNTPKPVRREVYGNGRIFDITHRYTPDLPFYGSKNGIGHFLWLQLSMKNASLTNNSEFDLPAHTGTHVDAPGHVFDDYFDAGFDVDQLDLDVLNAEVMKYLNIPKGTRRVLFKTLNTDRRLMHRKEFDSSFVGFTEDGAKWVVDNTDIKLVGTDYFSIATYDEAIPAHVAFLRGREIIPVEGLKLDDIQPGNYSVHCLPLRLLGAEGAPTRCILIK